MTVVGFLAAAAGLSRSQDADPEQLLRDCPRCAESVYVLAERCRYCGAELLDPPQVQAQPAGHRAGRSG